MRRSLKRTSAFSFFKKSRTADAKARRAALMARRGLSGGPTPVFPILITADKEFKFHDVDLDDGVIAAGGGITNSINLIAQGVTETTRVGRKCNIRQIGWRFLVDLPNTATIGNTADSVRVLMYLNKQANGATAAITDILESANYQSFNNLSNKNRFRTLMDRTYDLSTPAGAGNGTADSFSKEQVTDTFFKKVNIPIEFNSTAGAITEITSNNIGVLLISHAGLAGFESKIRLRFSDS